MTPGVEQADGERELLRESEERFRALADHAPVLLWVTDAAGRFTYVNQRWVDFTGRAPAEELGDGWQAGVHPADRAVAIDAFADHVAARTRFQAEYRLRRRDGEYRHVQAQASPRFLQGGAFAGFVASGVDVTERRRTEDAMRETNQQLAAVIRGSPLAIYCLDVDGVVRTWNRAAERMFGFTAAEAVGRPLPIVPSEKRGEFDAIRGRASDGEWIPAVEVVRVRKDGAPIDLSVSAAPLRDANGSVVGVVGMAADISARKQADRDRADLLRAERRARADAEYARGRLAFLAEASAVLASSLDYESTLQRVAELVVPNMATWCAVDVADGDGRLRRLAVAHVDPAKVAMAQELDRKYPPDPARRYGAYEVLRTGRPELYGTIDEQLLLRTARDEQHLRIMRDLCMRSAMVVPLTARGRTLGVLTFISCDADRPYGQPDLDLAEDLARRAATAVDNAMLYADAKAALAERNRSTALLKTIFGSAPVGLAYFDAGFRYVRVNPFLADIHGLPVERHLGRTMAEVLPENWRVCEPLFRQVLATGRPVVDVEMSGETPLRPGAPRDWLCSVYPVRSEDDDERAVLGIGMVVAEITDQKRAQRELADARDAAEAANRAKDQFLAVLSHELRTPLTPVLTMLGSLETEPGLSDEMRQGLAMIHRNVNLEARLIDDLLDLTRVAKGKLRLDLQTTDAVECLTTALDICAAEAREKGLKLVTELNATRTLVRGDAGRLQQVFWNLIKNAVKFTPADGTITLRADNPSPDRVVLEVADTGIGIDAEVLPRIFFAFEQAEQSITRRFGGLGLGLAISKSLIDMHGGRLSAKSEGTNRGSTFQVELSVVAGHVPAPPSPRDRWPSPLPPTAAAVHKMTQSYQPSSPPTSPDPAARPPRALSILMVDDHEDTVTAMRRLLQKLGHHVEWANSVQAALSVAGDKQVDLLISDIGLPDGSGLELMAELLKRRPVKGIALSGFGMEEDVRRSLDAGFSEHLTKPVDFERLQGAIRRIAGGQ